MSPQLGQQALLARDRQSSHGKGRYQERSNPWTLSWSTVPTSSSSGTTWVSLALPHLISLTLAQQPPHFVPWYIL